MNKTKVSISWELQKLTQKGMRWPCGICGRGVGPTTVTTTATIYGSLGFVADYPCKPVPER